MVKPTFFIANIIRNNVTLFVALRYLTTKNKDRFISIINLFTFLGVMLGVATLIIVMSVMNGYERELVGKILGIRSHIMVSNYHENIVDYDQVSAGIAAMNGVVHTSPVVEGQGLAVHGQQALPIFIKAMPGKALFSRPLLKDVIDCEDKSSFLAENSDDLAALNDIIVGKDLLAQLGLQVGERLKLLIPQSDSTIMGLIPRIKTYRIVGSFDVGMYEYNSSLILMPFPAAQLLLDLGDRANTIEVIVDELGNVNKVATDIMVKLRQNDQNYSVINWEQNNQSLVEALRTERYVMFLILMLIIIIAVFNIISSLIILVKDKSKGIAILRTLGLTNAGVIRIFMLYGFSIGAMATFCGAGLGIIFALNIEKIRVFIEKVSGQRLFEPAVYFLTHLPAQISWAQTSLVVAIALLLSLLATIYPARKIAKLSPAEILRYE